MKDFICVSCFHVDNEAVLPRIIAGVEWQKEA